MRLRAVTAAAVLSAFVAGPVAFASNDPGFKDQWGLHRVGAEGAWSASTGAGVVIAVVDTGVDLNHPDLKANIVGGLNRIEPGQPPQDDHGHGTHVAGIAAALANNGMGVAGTAPAAKIMPVRVLRKDGNDASGSIADVNAGIRWAADNGARVINLSLGEQINLRTVTGSSLEDAINYAWGKGSIPVVAAGNENFALLFPSGYRNVNALVVGATTRNDQRASFSNDVGDAKWGMVAPGVDILSTWMDGSYASASGTSMAAPFVSGGAALVRAQGQSAQQTVDRLLATARNIGSSVTYGRGILDANAAVIRSPAPAGGGGGGGQSVTGSSPAPGTARPPSGSKGRTPGVTEQPSSGSPTSSPATPSPSPESSALAEGPSDRGPDRRPGGRGLAALLLVSLSIAAAGGAVTYLRLRRGP